MKLIRMLVHLLTRHIRALHASGKRKAVINPSTPQRPLPIFPVLIVASLVLGWLIPGFYEWTGSDQSRPSPLIWQFALGMTFIGCVICLLLPWLPIPTQAQEETRESNQRFTLKNLLVLTTVIAIMIVALMKFPMVVSCLLGGAAFANYAWLVVRHPQLRLRAAALLSCMCLPFVWFIGYGEISNICRVLLGIAAGLPMLLPSAWLASWFGTNFHSAPWISVLLTGLELLVGTWVIRLGTKPAIAFLVFALLVSVFSSFGLHALVLA